MSETVDSTRPRQASVSMRELARRGYYIGTWVMLAVIVGQFAAAGAGLFSVLARDPQGATGVTILLYHAGVGPVFVALISVVMVVLAFVGRLPWRMTGMAAAFFPLLILQSLFIIPYRYPNDIPVLGHMPWLSALHVLNALFIFWLTIQWPAWTRQLSDPGRVHSARTGSPLT